MLTENASTIDIEGLVNDYKSWISTLQAKYAHEIYTTKESIISAIKPLFPTFVPKEFGIVTTSEFLYPPLDHYNLPKLFYWLNNQLSGITFGNVNFLKNYSVSILLHEVIHVTQRYFLGFNRFTSAYI